MGLTYDGITYRSLEEQVRYDAEQVQLLKQADVTINENLQTVNESLQTVNTEINGKLTKPANPSAESAITMLADGTVGTKPLSEICGSGGKLYRHDITKTINGVRLTLSFFDSKSTALTANEIMIKHNGNNTAFVSEINNSTYYVGGGILNAVIPTSDSHNITFYGVLYGVSQGSPKAYTYSYDATVPGFLTDATYAVIEL